MTDGGWQAYGVEVAPPDADELSELRTALLEVVRERGTRYFEEPVTLASGELSHHFVDAKRALARGRDLVLCARTIVALAAQHGADFDAVGGLTLGADHLAHGVALLADRSWFVVRKRAKDRGTAQRLEGTPIGESSRVLLVDDVVTTGGSIAEAYEAVRATGATTVLATTVVDRGESASRWFARREVPYEPLLTYRDLGMEPVGGAVSDSS